MNLTQEVNKITFILDNQSKWRDRGYLFKSLRESENLTRSYVATQLGISHGRLKRFEDGQPVNDAKLLEYAYNHFLHNHRMRGESNE